MTFILQGIYDILAQLVCWILTALVTFANMVIAFLGALILFFVDLLPSMDDAEDGIPGVPEQFETAGGWINWVFPVSSVLLLLEFIFLAWITWQVVLLVLRWAKATGE